MTDAEIDKLLADLVGEEEDSNSRGNVVKKKGGRRRRRKASEGRGELSTFRGTIPLHSIVR